MKRIGVLCSGGDGPGLNPCIRAVVRMGIELGMEIYGIRRGFAGLIDGETERMDARSVGGIISRGGTMLGTARSLEFMEERGRREALRNLNKLGIEGLIVIGGNGSLMGAHVLHQMGFPVVGAPGTIDNDLSGTDMAIGVDTALNTVIEAIDKIKDTASSHQRAFLIEVMGRNCGYLALMSGIASGAEHVLIPEMPCKLEDVAHALEDSYIRGKAHCIIIVAEGAKPGTQEVTTYLTEDRDRLGFRVRVTVLGHVQRGGSPTAFDRLLATRLGCAAVKTLKEGRSDVMVGLVGNKIAITPLEEALAKPRAIDVDIFRLAEILAK